MFRKLACLVALFAFVSTSSTGCIGRMAVTAEVMKFNLRVAETKWGREAVFLILYIIPVYGFAGLIDLVVVNSIEFWTGTNPVSGESRLAKVGDQKHVVGPDGGQAVSTLREDGSIDIEIREASGTEHFINLIRQDGGMMARDAEGQQLGRLDEHGAVHLAPRVLTARAAY